MRVFFRNMFSVFLSKSVPFLYPRNSGMASLHDRIVKVVAQRKETLIMAKSNRMLYPWYKERESEAKRMNAKQ